MKVHTYVPAIVIKTAFLTGVSPNPNRQLINTLNLIQSLLCTKFYIYVHMYAYPCMVQLNLNM